jgi:hypothetical protein
LPESTRRAGNSRITAIFSVTALARVPLREQIFSAKLPKTLPGPRWKAYAPYGAGQSTENSAASNAFVPR